jgi:hypothetical protein
MLEIIAGSAMAMWALAAFTAPIVAVCLAGGETRPVPGGAHGSEVGERSDVRH